ncbi:hypothetical protein LOTGIDRAFT_174127 [Lottia gigantea]|uniref:Uncharacterized protein n=1 Tax=Lottia gigantea TaxID=225164 RepID=V4A3W0_LOTGI|nr:hypothetical protein LOTGIDRAFT_174127 [Lottia gigantea]ESO98593.1 hypothetical protein LOTGIDRAFT_174127 [Lottia gigantea]
MTATDVARIIMVVQFLIFGLYSVASELLQRAVAVAEKTTDRMVFRVHDGQIIFAEMNWGLMKFDVKTNRQLFNYKVVYVKKFNPSNSILSIDHYGNEASLYWSGPRNNQISRYLINSNINQIVVREYPSMWVPLNVQQTLRHSCRK